MKKIPPSHVGKSDFERLDCRSRCFLRLIAPCLIALCISQAANAAVGPEESAGAQEHAKRGIELFQSGDARGAESELRKAADLSPNDVIILTTLGSVFGVQGKLHESSSYFKKALQIDPGNVGARRNLAANQWQLGQLKEARDNLEQILKMGPKDQQTLLLRGMVAERMKDYGRAVECLESASDLVLQRVETLAALARSYYRTDRPRKARDTLAMLMPHPGGPKGVFVGAHIAAEVGDFDTAEKMFASISETYPDPVALGYNLALVRYNAGRLKQSEEGLLEVIGNGQGNCEIYVLLGWCYHRQNKQKEAISAFERATEVSPSNETAYLDYAKILLEDKLLPGALKVTEKGVQRVPSSSALYSMRGLIEGQLNHHFDAIKSFTQALRIDPSSAEANRGLAVAQFRAGRLEEAAATFEQGIKSLPADALMYLEYSGLLLKLSEKGDASAGSRAVALLQKALSLDRSLAEAHYQLGNFFQSEGRIAEALPYLESAVRLDPGSSRNRYVLWRAYRRLGRESDAAEEFEVYKRLKVGEEPDLSDRLAVTR